MMLHKYSQIEYSIRRKTTCIIYYQDYANSLTNTYTSVTILYKVILLIPTKPPGC